MDRLAERRRQREQIDEMMRASDAVFLVFNGLLLAFDVGRSPMFVAPNVAPDAQRVLLGEHEGRRWFAVADSAFDAHEWTEVRDALLRDPQLDASMLLYARGMMHWHDVHRFCARCGSATVAQAAGHERLCTNAECATVAYPRVDPAVIVRITCGERILLARHTRYPGNMFSTLAGFVEVGESLEETVAREIREESGVIVKNVRYFGSQPWPFPSSLMVGFTAEAEDDALTIDSEEIAEARWLTRAELQAARESGELRIPPRLSIARRLIDSWLLSEQNDER